MSWHPGEVALQAKLGVAERMAELGQRVLRDHMIEQHRDFFPLLPFAVLGAVDPAGDVWATIRSAPPGFLHAIDPWELAVDLPRDRHDPADAGMEDGDRVALLGIQLSSRRRNRANGRVRRLGDAGFSIAVEQSFGNCPKYITAREPSLPPRRPGSAPDEATIRDIVGRADTFFVASSADGAVDVSHRGGEPGFVRMDGQGRLTIPDYPGNMFFNTLGNFLVNAKGGLAFPDFTNGGLLQMSGEVEVIVESPQTRFWRFTPRRTLFSPAP